MKTITGQFLFSDTTPIAGGRLFLSLSNDAVALGVAQIAPKTIVIQLDANGKIPTGTTIYANDELNPDGTFYTATIIDINGARVWGSEIFPIVGVSPIDLTLLTPGLAGGVVIFATFAQLNVIQTWTAVQTFAVGTLAINPGPLTLASAATAARTATFPDNTGTVAEINLAQTWSATQTFSVAPVPNAAGSIALGTSALPFSAVFIGGAATNNIQLAGTATAARTATFPDNTGTVAELNLAQTWTAAQTINAPTGQSVDIFDVQLNAVNLLSVSRRGEVIIAAVSSGAFSLQVVGMGTSSVVLQVANNVSVTPALAGADALTVKCVASQVGNLVVVKTSTPATLFTLGPSGAIAITPTATNIVRILINSPSGQSANHIDIQSNSVSKLTIDSTGSLILKGGAAASVAASQVGLGSTTATTATAGAQALPANPAGFWIVNIGGTTQKIPYYNS